MTIDEVKALLDLIKPMRLDLTRECNDLQVTPENALIRLNRIQELEALIVQQLRDAQKKPSPEYVSGYKAAMRNCAGQFRQICNELEHAPMVCVAAVKASCAALDVTASVGL